MHRPYDENEQIGTNLLDETLTSATQHTSNIINNRSKNNAMVGFAAFFKAQKGCPAQANGPLTCWDTRYFVEPLQPLQQFHEKNTLIT